MLDIVKTVERVTNRPVNYEFSDRRPDDPGFLVVNSEKSKKKLGWQNKFGDIDTIITSAWNKLKEN